MNTYPSKLKLAAFVFVMLSFATACKLFSVVRGGNLITKTETIETGTATSVRATIELGVGELQLSGGADKLMDATFNYNIAEWNPQVTYATSGDTGLLTVAQPDFEGFPGNVTNQWVVRLSNAVPLDLTVHTGAAKSELDLAGLSLTQVQVEAGAGETVIDLTGYRAQDLNVAIKAGAGSTTLRLPRDVGVRVEPKIGAGQVYANGLKQDGNIYTNDALGQSEHTIYVQIEAGLGSVYLQAQ